MIGGFNFNNINTSGTTLMKYKLSSKFHVMLGPQAALRYAAKDVYTAEVFQQDDLQYEVDIKDQYKALDFGFTGGLGFCVKPRGITLGVRYYQGLTDILKDNTGGKRQSG